MADIEKFDPSTLMQGVKDRIKATFISLIPDEQWEQMVKSEIDKFFMVTSTEGYNYTRKNSDFGAVVNRELETLTKEKVKEYLQSEAGKILWTQNGYKLSETMENAIKEGMPNMFMNIMTNAIASVIQQIPNKVY